MSAREAAKRVRAKERATQTVLREPFALPRASFFHAALGIPLFESASLLEPGVVYARIQSTHASSKKQRNVAGVKNLFDGLYHEWFAFDVRTAVTPRLELGLRAVIAGWDETHDRFSLFDSAGQPTVRFEDRLLFGIGASARHDNLSVIDLEAKALLAKVRSIGLDIAVAGSVKLPVGRERDLTNAGTYDLGLTFLATLPVGPAVLHANAGGTSPLGNQSLFVAGAQVNLDPVLQGSLGLTLPLSRSLAAGIQIEADTSAFGDVPFLDGTVVTAAAGVRKHLGNYIVELGGGAGLRSSSYDWIGFFSVGRLF